MSIGGACWLDNWLIDANSNRETGSGSNPMLDYDSFFSKIAKSENKQFRRQGVLCLLLVSQLLAYFHKITLLGAKNWWKMDIW